MCQIVNILCYVVVVKDMLNYFGIFLYLCYQEAMPLSQNLTLED